MRPIVCSCRLTNGKIYLLIEEAGRKTWNSSQHINALNVQKYKWMSNAAWEQFWSLMMQRAVHMHFMPIIKYKEPEKHRHPRVGSNGQLLYEVQRVSYTTIGLRHT